MSETNDQRKRNMHVHASNIRGRWNFRTSHAHIITSSYII